jgi:hypothetical protein
VGYTSETAMVLHAARRTAAEPPAKLEVGGVTWGVVLTLLSWKWSPQQIAATLKRVYPESAIVVNAPLDMKQERTFGRSPAANPNP